MNSPFALPFNDALSSPSFLAKIRESSEHQLRRELGQGLGSGAKSTLALSKFVYERGKLLVDLPKGKKVADLMVANGHRVAQLKNVAGGAGTRLQVVAGGAKVGANTAAVALVVIEVAHMISAHDNAKRLKRIERHTQRIVEFQEAELVAELEACYRQAKEVCLAMGGESTEHDRALLSHLGQSLFRIRSQWRHRVRANLAEIDKASAAKWTHVIRWKRESSLEKSKKKRGDEADESRELLQLMQFSLMLQFALSERTGRASSFIEHTLVDEVANWRELANFAQSRGTVIFGDRVPANYCGFTTGIESIAAYWDVVATRDGPYETTASTYAKQHSISIPAARKFLNAEYEQGRCLVSQRGKQFIYTFSSRPRALSLR